MMQAVRVTYKIHIMNFIRVFIATPFSEEQVMQASRQWIILGSFICNGSGRVTGRQGENMEASLSGKQPFPCTCRL